MKLGEVKEKDWRKKYGWDEMSDRKQGRVSDKKRWIIGETVYSRQGGSPEFLLIFREGQRGVAIQRERKSEVDPMMLHST